MKRTMAPIIGLIAFFQIDISLAGTFAGNVKDESGLPIPGAMVTLSDTKNGVAETVYTDANGRFDLTPRLVRDSVQLRVRKPYFEDLSSRFDLTATGASPRELVMRPMKSDLEISESLPAAFHFGQLPFQKSGLFSKSTFQRDCLSCHQLGNAFTRSPKSAEVWEDTVERMHSYMGSIDKASRRIRAAILEKGFNGEPLHIRPEFPFSEDITHAKVTEYRMEKGIIPHDAEVSRVDGLVYTVDQFADSISTTNLESGQTEYYEKPHAGLKPGGKFTDVGLPPPGQGALEVYHGPHSLALGPDNKWYVTLTFATKIGVFNPDTRQWERSFDIPDVPDMSLYPHTIRFDASGIAWFTLAFSEQVGRLDPKTGDVKVIALPDARSLGISAGTAPYGIDVSPTDGTVWISRLWADKIDRIDPVTLKVLEFDSPVKGPRRLRFDHKGTLWVSGYSEGVIARIETNGFESKVIRMPEFAPNYRPAPYALAVHPLTHDIWVAETMTDHLYRFIPGQERWIAYPMPLRGTYTREISFTRDGSVCTSNSPVPNVALESGINELICLDPNAQ